MKDKELEFDRSVHTIYSKDVHNPSVKLVKFIVKLSEVTAVDYEPLYSCIKLCK